MSNYPNSSNHNVAKSESHYGGHNLFRQKNKFGYGMPGREDQRDDKILELESDGVGIFSNCNKRGTNDDNFIFESSSSNIIRSKTKRDNIA